MSGVANLIFIGRNGEKIFDATNNNGVAGDESRVFAAFSQTMSTLKDFSARSLGMVTTGAVRAVDAVNNVGNSIFGVKDVASKASNLVNPLLCVASGVRMLNDDNPAVIPEELCAMGAMFAAETLYKGIVRKPIEELVKQGATSISDINPEKLLKELKAPPDATNKLNRFLEKATNKVSRVALGNKTLESFYTEAAKKISGMSSTNKKGLFIAAEVGFVLASILGFTKGRELGCALTGRSTERKEKTSNPFIEEALATSTA